MQLELNLAAPAAFSAAMAGAAGKVVVVAGKCPFLGGQHQDPHQLKHPQPPEYCPWRVRRTGGEATRYVGVGCLHDAQSRQGISPPNHSS